MAIESKESFNTRCELMRETLNLRKKYYGCMTIPNIAIKLKINASSIYRFANGENISQNRLDMLFNFFKEHEPARLEIAQEELGLKEKNILKTLGK